MHRNEGENAAWSEDGKSSFRTSPPYTVMTPEWANAVQEEIMNIIEKIGLPVLSQGNDTHDQLYEAINGLSSVPIGSIIAWLPGYFADGSNGSFTVVTDIELPGNWRECTGATVNDADSPIYNGAGRYLPNLTDDRFLMGDIAGSAGGIGGDNSSAHTHSVPNHQHQVGEWLETGGEYTLRMYNSAGDIQNVVQNWVTVNLQTGASPYKFGQVKTGNTDLYSKTDGSSTTGGASDVENRPLYLSVRYIQRIK